MSTMRTNRAAEARAGRVRAKRVAGPIAIGPRDASALATMSSEQVIAQARRRQEDSTTNMYVIGLCLRELARPERYRRELGFKSFGELLEAHGLCSRMTAHKYITVVSTFTLPQTQRAGSVEKAYALVRYSRRVEPAADPRALLERGAQVLGRNLRDVSGRAIRGALPNGGRMVARGAAAQAKKASLRLRNELKRAKIPHRTRLHTHYHAPCVAAHLVPSAALLLAEALERLRKGVTESAVTTGG